MQPLLIGERRQSGNPGILPEVGKPGEVRLTSGGRPIDLQVDSLPSNAININSVGELEGLLGPGIDVSSLMGGSLSVANFGISAASFPDGFSGVPSSGKGLPCFQLDTVRNIRSISVRDMNSNFSWRKQGLVIAHAHFISHLSNY